MLLPKKGGGGDQFRHLYNFLKTTIAGSVSETIILGTANQALNFQEGLL